MSDVAERPGNAAGSEPGTDAEQTRERMRELGRLSGVARRRKRDRSTRDELIEGAKGSKNAAGLAALLRQLPPEPEPRPPEPASPTLGSAALVDVLRVMWQIDPAGVERMLEEAGILEAAAPPTPEGGTVAEGVRQGIRTRSPASASDPAAKEGSS